MALNARFFLELPGFYQRCKQAGCSLTVLSKTLYVLLEWEIMEREADFSQRDTEYDQGLDRLLFVAQEFSSLLVKHRPEKFTKIAGQWKALRGRFLYTVEPPSRDVNTAAHATRL